MARWDEPHIGRFSESIACLVWRSLVCRRIEQHHLIHEQRGLFIAFAGDKEKAIILRAEEGVPIEKAVSVLDIANRNQIKVVLAVRPK